MKNKTKRILKNVGLGALGVVAIGAAVFGGNKIYETVKDNTKNVVLSYDVGGLNEATGKFEEDSKTLYTKEKFACYGLKATLDFDAQIEYQIFYYDILDNYLSSSVVLNSGFSDEAPLNGAYARIEITPLNDEDGKISLTEKFKYGSQLKVRVAKDAVSKLDERYTLFKGKTLQVVQNVGDTVFVKGISLKAANGVYSWNDAVSSNSAATSTTILAVKGGEKFTLNCANITIPTDLTELQFKVYEFDKLPASSEVKQLDSLYNGVESSAFVSQSKEARFNASTRYVLMSFYAQGLTTLTDSFVNQIQSAITIAK